MNLYEELELPRDCTFDEIKQQYRHLASIHHPDKGGDVEKFKRIKLAYEVLSDPERRKTYNETNVISESRSLRSESISELSTVFFKVIANVDLHNGDLVNTMRTEINTVLTITENDTVLCNKYIENLEVAKQKLIHKNPNEENILLGFIETQLSIRHNDLKIFKKRKELYEYMLVLLDDYQYGFLELPINIGSE